MPTNYSCNVNGLLLAANCYGDQCMAQPQRDALIIWARIKNLAAIGGVDYSNNLPRLMVDSATWRTRALDQLKAIEVYISLQNAIADGASINLNRNSLALAAKCIKAQCLGKVDTDGLKAFLNCSIETTDNPS